MGYYEEKKKYEELLKNNSSPNKCPKCKKGNLVVSVNQNSNKTIFTSFCPSCGNTIKSEVKNNNSIGETFFEKVFKNIFKKSN